MTVHRTSNNLTDKQTHRQTHRQTNTVPEYIYPVFIHVANKEGTAKSEGIFKSELE